MAVVSAHPDSRRYFHAFVGLSLALIIAVGTALFYAEQRQLERALLEIAANRADLLSHQMTRVIRDEFMIPAMKSAGSINLRDPETLATLDGLIHRYFSRQNIIRVVLYDGDQQVSYSTHHPLIGADGSRNPLVTLALQGTPTSHLVEKAPFDDLDAGSRGLEGEIVETYTPFEFEFNGAMVRGVVELYQDVTEPRARLAVLSGRMLYTVLAAFAALFVMLVAITSRIDRRREEMERQARDTGARLDTMLQTMGEGVAALDKNLSIVMVNDELARVFDCDKAALMGRPFRDLLAPSSWLAIAEGVTYLMGQWRELTGRRASGAEFPMEIRMERASSERGVIYTLALRDITERIRAQEKIKLMALFASLTPNLVLRCQPDGVVEMTNPAAMRILGVTQDKPVTLMELVRGVTREQVAQVIRDDSIIIHAAPVGERHYRFVLKGSSDHQVALVYGTDITELKLVEEDLRRARDVAEEATRLKDKFVSLVAHDLRMPLGGIIQFLRYLRETAAPVLSDEQRQLAANTQASGENLLEMIDQLLDISRLRTGNITMTLEAVSLHKLAVTALADICHVASEKGIELLCDVPPEKRVWADKKLGVEVLRNLLSNAIKFTDKGGSIRIFTPEAGEGVIAVSDTGTGVPPGILPDLFRHEVKTSMPGTRGERGTGLGLPLSYDIMTAMGGTLTAESRAGEGATFYAVFPAPPDH